MFENIIAEENLSASAMTMFEERGNTTSRLDNGNLERRKEKQVVEVCKLCFKTFTNRSNYKYHMAHHGNECPWHCNECSKSYKTKADLLQHQQRVHLKVKGPPRTFTDKGPSKNQPKKCDICDKMFTDLRSHIRSVHQKIRQHICTICLKAFGKKSGLDRHITTVHDKMRHWSCDLCEKSFGEKTLLTRHRKIHFKTNAYGHDSQNTEIIEDQEIITEDKRQMRCGICRKLLNSRAALKRHKLLVHDKKQNLLCDFCPKLFGEKSNLLRHIKRLHAKESGLMKAEPQMQNENNPTNISNKNESYSCSSCDRVLTTKWGFQAHQEICRIRQQQKFNNEQDQHRGDEEDEEINKNENRKTDKEEKDEDKSDEDESDKDESDKDDSDKDESDKDESDKGEHDKDESGKDESDKDESDKDDSDQDESDKEESNREENVKDENVKDKKDLQHVNRLEQIFLVDEDEVETVQVKQEPIFSDESMPVKCDPAVSEEATASHSLHVKIKVEPKVEHVHAEHLEPKLCETDVEDLGCYSDLFQNSSSDDDCQVEENSESELNYQHLRHHKRQHPELSLQLDRNEKCSEDDDEQNRTCDRCDPKKVFQYKRNFRRHMKNVHSEHTFTCNQCDRSFSVKQSLDRHVKGVHENKRNFKCEEMGCEKLFISKFELNEHLIATHNRGDKSLRTCKICLKVFKRSKYLKTHISSVHNDEPAFSCSFCNRGFSFYRSLTRHIRAIHEDRRDVKCTVVGCVRNFRSRYELNEHVKNIHMDASETENVEVPCDLCEKVLSSRKALYTHKKGVHERVRWSRKNQCKLCKEIFMTKYKKNKHWNQVHHNGKLVFRKCQLCGSEFQLFEDYKAHIESHVGHFICIICGSNFSEESSLFVHMESHKTIENELRLFVCDICQHRVSTKSQLSIHMRKHFNGDHYVCDVCGKSYKFIAPFLHHKKGHENQLDFPCRYCEKKFIINRYRMLHERTHTGERPYKCIQCQKSFAQKTVYLNHLKTHDVRSCKTCGMQFTSDPKLRLHIDAEHPEERPLRCCNCGKTFKASRALEAHKQKCGTADKRSDIMFS